MSFFCERSLIELNAHNFRKNILDGFLHLHGKVKDLKLKFHDYIYLGIFLLRYTRYLILCFPSSSFLFFSHLTNVGGGGSVRYKEYVVSALGIFGTPIFFQVQILPCPNCEMCVFV